MIDAIVRRRKLKKQLITLLARREALLTQLGHTKAGNISNARNSDRKFKENSAKAVTARAKRADKAALRTVDNLIKLTWKKLDKLEKE